MYTQAALHGLLLLPLPLLELSLLLLGSAVQPGDASILVLRGCRSHQQQQQVVVVLVVAVVPSVGGQVRVGSCLVLREVARL